MYRSLNPEHITRTIAQLRDRIQERFPGSGLGKVAGGEGVLGLQRAFQVAGAHTTVTSLWSVDDKATQQLMVRFYENRWEKKLPALEALMEAQRWMLAEGIKRGMVREPVAETAAMPRTPPYYWAAFILSGDWR